MKDVAVIGEPMKSPEDWDPFRFDVVLGEEKTVLKVPVFFGFSGRWKDKGNLCPFVLEPSGRIDFGAGFTDDRYYRTNIREKQIAIGELFSVWDEHEFEKVFRIIDIGDIAKN